MPILQDIKRVLLSQIWWSERFWLFELAKNVHTVDSADCRKNFYHIHFTWWTYALSWNTRMRLSISEKEAIEYDEVSDYDLKLTFLEFSRVAEILPKYWSSMGICTLIKMVVRIFCISYGNKYQLNASISSSISPNPLVIRWPSSHTPNIIPNAYDT